MALKPGYKQTEAGVVPDAWECTTVGQLVRDGILEKPLDGNHGNIHPKSGDFVSFGIPFVMASNVQSGHVDLNNCSFIRKKQADSLQKGFSRPGDVLLTHKATIGNTAVVGEIPFEYIMLTPQVTYYRVADQKRLSNLYLRQFFDSSFFQGVLMSMSGGGTRAYIGITAQLQLPVVVPPTKAEQEAIAEVLGDADVLIDSLEKLIAKKRNVKYAGMRELLTGKKRLPGFNGRWTVRAFAELFNFGGGFSASRDQLSSEGHCYLHYGDIHKSSKTFINVRTEYQEIPKLNIALKEVSQASLLDDGDVVFVDASEDDDGASKHVVIINKDKIPYIAGLHTIVAKSKSDSLDHNYRRYCFQTREVKQQFYYYAVGTKVTGISKTNIPKLVLPVPPLDEQAAIAAILTGMDSEIAALELKLFKYRQLKQGMMHNLLTGKIRLGAPALAEVKPAAPTREESTGTATGSGSHTWAFNEAVIISVLADQFGKPEFPLGRKRRTKLSYLFHRKTDQEVQGYLKKAAGPYNPRAKYAGPEKIAQENGYVRNHQSGKFNGFVAAEKIAQAKTYFAKWYEPKITAWLEQFRFKSNDELECLATVDMAMQELLKQDKTADVDSVRALIASEPDWLPKLDRSAFSDSGIAEAIAQCHALFG